MPFGRLVGEPPERPVMRICRRCLKPTPSTVWNARYGDICFGCSSELEGDEGPKAA